MADKEKTKVETVPLYKFRNSEKREKIAQDEITELRAKNQAQERELVLANQNIEDEDGAKVIRQAIAKEYAELDAKQAQFNKDVAANDEKVMTADAKELSVALKGEGIEVSVESLLTEEDMAAKANELRVEHYKGLAEQGKGEGADKDKEGAEKSPEASAASVYDTTGAGAASKDKSKMTDDEFDKDWSEQYANAQGR